MIWIVNASSDLMAGLGLANPQSHNCPVLRTSISDAIDNNADIFKQGLREQWSQLMEEAKDLETIRINIFLTSRPEIPIFDGFRQLPGEAYQVLYSIISRLIQLMEIDLLSFGKSCRH